MKPFRKRKSTLKLELVIMINAFNKTDIYWKCLKL